MKNEDITSLVNKVGGAHKNVSNIVQYFLIDERRFVERHPQNNNEVRLKALGSECYSYQSEIQEIRKRLHE
jgi:hypothetical protein